MDSLSEAELREDCRERGMLGLVSVEEMRQQVPFHSYDSRFFVMYYQTLSGKDNVPVVNVLVSK